MFYSLDGYLPRDLGFADLAVDFCQDYGILSFYFLLPYRNPLAQAFHMGPLARTVALAWTDYHRVGQLIRVVKTHSAGKVLRFLLRLTQKYHLVIDDGRRDDCVVGLSHFVDKKRDLPEHYLVSDFYNHLTLTQGISFGFAIGLPQVLDHQTRSRVTLPRQLDLALVPVRLDTQMELLDGRRDLIFGRFGVFIC